MQLGGWVGGRGIYLSIYLLFVRFVTHSSSLLRSSSVPPVCSVLALAVNVQLQVRVADVGVRPAEGVAILLVVDQRVEHALRADKEQHAPGRHSSFEVTRPTPCSTRERRRRNEYRHHDGTGIPVPVLEHVSIAYLFPLSRAASPMAAANQNAKRSYADRAAAVRLKAAVKL